MRYQTLEDANEERQAEYARDLETCEAESLRYIRSYLISVRKVVDEAIALVHEGGHKLEYDMSFDGDASSALDDILCGDRIGEFVGRELDRRTQCSYHAINAVAKSFSGRTYEI